MKNDKKDFRMLGTMISVDENVMVRLKKSAING